MDEPESYKFCELSLSLSGKLFLLLSFTLLQMWHVSFRGRSCLHWLYWKKDIAPTGIERDSIPTYHETHVFATVIRSFHCFKIGSFKFLAEWGSVYWLTAYCISMPPSLLARFIKKNAVHNPILPAQWLSGRASALWPGGCGFDPRPGHTKDFKNGTSCSFAWRSALRK